jgi:hypothetical protein
MDLRNPPKSQIKKLRAEVNKGFKAILANRLVTKSKNGLRGDKHMNDNRDKGKRRIRSY